ncbi:MAG: hypothetical protein COT43_05505 [Candidatus Marinimicrobia bacterium CG08_land_8_20_14_0_20_45_22]|nr:MAG: hypothetical protein COT43_05505 [Candidatus Marinimicrobia bacterium CG08_land_8_20_14_0_20_45_22]
MKNFGVIIFIVGFLLLVLDAWVIKFLGGLGLVIGLLAILIPEKMTEIVIEITSKFDTKTHDSK